jgi:hypothetical protein
MSMALTRSSSDGRRGSAMPSTLRARPTRVLARDRERPASRRSAPRGRRIGPELRVIPAPYRAPTRPGFAGYGRAAVNPSPGILARGERFELAVEGVVQSRARIAGMRVEPASLRSRSSRRSSSPWQPSPFEQRSSALLRSPVPATSAAGVAPTWIGPSTATRRGLAWPTQAAIRHLKAHHRGRAQSPVETVQRTSPE